MLFGIYLQRIKSDRARQRRVGLETGEEEESRPQQFLAAIVEVMTEFNQYTRYDSTIFSLASAVSSESNVSRGGF